MKNRVTNIYWFLKKQIQYVLLTAFFVRVPNNGLTGNNFNISVILMLKSLYLKIKVPWLSNLLQIELNAFVVSSFQLSPKEPYY